MMIISVLPNPKRPFIPFIKGEGDTGDRVDSLEQALPFQAQVSLIANNDVV